MFLSYPVKPSWGLIFSVYWESFHGLPVKPDHSLGLWRREETGGKNLNTVETQETFKAQFHLRV